MTAIPNKAIESAPGGFCESGDEAIWTLVENGAVIDKRGEDGSTPLHYAAMFGNYRAAQCLVELGAKCVRDIYGNSPSALAIGKGEVYGWLQEHGF